MAVRDPLQYARDLQWAPWEKYPVVWTASTANPSIGNGSITGKFRREGTIGYCRGAISLGTTTTAGTGQWQVSLPSGWVISSDPTPDGYQIGLTVMVPTAGSAYSGFAWALPGESLLRLVTNAAIPLSVTSTSPATWTANVANFLSWNIGPLELD